MNIPMIGLPARRKDVDQYIYHAIGEPYLQAIQKAGGCPVILPITRDEKLIERMLSHVHGIFLAGGGDVAPELYGERREHAEGVDQVTDAFETMICQRCFERDIPLLAVCRGLQALNVAAGGTLIQDIRTEIPTPVNHQQHEDRHTCTHGIRVDPHSRMAQILGETCFKVNSFHHQAIDRPGKGLKPVAWSAEDGLVEGVESAEHRFLLGVQFHPEEICEDSLPAEALLKALVRASQ